MLNDTFTANKINWKEIEKYQSWWNLRCYPRICLARLGKTITSTIVRIVRQRFVIRTSRICVRNVTTLTKLLDFVSSDYYAELFTYESCHDQT
jgi:hypothetical protein